jgi:hypothetical protein
MGDIRTTEPLVLTARPRETNAAAVLTTPARSNRSREAPEHAVLTRPSHMPGDASTAHKTCQRTCRLAGEPYLASDTEPAHISAVVSV